MVDAKSYFSRLKKTNLTLKLKDSILLFLFYIIYYFILKRYKNSLYYRSKSKLLNRIFRRIIPWIVSSVATSLVSSMTEKNR